MTKDAGTKTLSGIDPAIMELVGDADYDREAIKARYAYERDARLRSDTHHQYIEAGADFSHYAEDPYVERIERDAISGHNEVVIIGGGLGGLLTAVRLQQAGFNDIRIIEKGGDLGGTWYWNRYPGLRCDIDSRVYLPMIERVGRMPAERYSRGSEIFDHLRDLAKRHDLYQKACLQTEVTSLTWNDNTEVWQIGTDRSDLLTAHFVVLANGILDKPKLPGIPGIGSFKGHTFHTSRWDYAYTGGDQTGGLEGLRDKRVGIVGTGATAVQVVPVLGENAKQLYVFQRTPAAVDIRANRALEPDWVASLKPGWQAEWVANFAHHAGGVPQGTDLVADGFSQIGKMLDPTASWAGAVIGRPLTEEEGAFINETLDDHKMNAIRARIDEVVDNPIVAEALKPWHRRFCKRPLFSDDYLPTFNRPNVTLVDTAGRGIERFTETGAVVAGKEYPLDCLIFATGYEVGTEYVRRSGYDVVGRNGLELSRYWKDGMRTFQGMFVRGFPNCFVLGFGQNAPSTSFTFMLDEQAKHVAATITQMSERGRRQFEPTVEAVDGYVAQVKPLSISQLQFWVDCTPSYLNGEGDSDNPHSFFANLHPAGTIGFYSMLAQWREDNRLEGLALT